MQGSTLAKRGWLLLLLATACVYFYGLGRAPLVGADEPRYAEVAREMFVRGDPVTPTLGGHTWFEKPALPYWAAMLSYKLFGVSEWSARLGAVCASLLAVLLISVLAGKFETAAGETLRDLQLAATATAATSAGLIVFARALNFDIFITLATTGALVCFLLAELTDDSRRRLLLLAGFYSCMGFGLLAKGLLGIVLPAGVIVLYCVLRRAWPRGLSTLLWGVPLMCAVAGCWYAFVIARHGWTFIDEFFVQHHFARYVSNKYHHPQPVYFYLPIMALLALPWTGFLIAALSTVLRWRWRGDEPADKLRVFALAWLVLPVAFFSVSGSKLPGYILPALPGAALLAGERLAAYLRGAGSVWTMRATGLLLLLFTGGMLAYAVQTSSISTACTLCIVTPALVMCVCALVWAGRRQLCMVGLVATTFITVVIVVTCALVPAARGESVRELLRAAEARGYTNAPVYGLHTIERTAEFYAAGRLVYDAHGEPIKLEGAEEVVKVAQPGGGPVLVLVPLEYIGQLTTHARLACDVIGNNGKVALVAVRTR